MKMNNELLFQALEYLNSGFSIIPIGIDKKPLLGWTRFQTKRPTENEVREWFDKYENIAGIAIVTGAISGVVVVDVEKGGKIDDLPKTVMSQSGGDGFHLYYKYDPQYPRRNSTRIRDLTDIRGNGGYIIAPPSLHESGKKYTWQTTMNREDLNDFPSWLLDTPSDTSSQSSLRSENIATSVPKGARNDTATKMAGKILHNMNPKLWDTEGWKGFQLWNTESCKPPMDTSELRNVWDSIKKAEDQKRGGIGQPERPKQEKQHVTEIYWQRTRDGRIIEAYYDPIEAETGLLVFENGEAKKTPQIIIDGNVYTAPPATNSLIKSGFVKLPSETLAYDSEMSLLQEVKSFIHCYVQIPTGFEDIAAFYTLFSWVYDHFEELPYLRAIGDYGSGKSRFLKVMGALCYRPIFLNGSASVSSIFRMINDVKGTLIFDEADFRTSDTTSEIIKILNSGFQKGIPVFRSEATGNKMKSYDPTAFDVFCPKIISTRKDFTDDALESRCLNNAMETLTRDDIPESLESDFESRSLLIRNKLVMFRFQKLSGGISKDPLPKLDIEPRLKQIISPLYRVISDPAGKEIILDFIRSKQVEVIERRRGSFEGELLKALLNVLGDSKEPTMQDIADDYNKIHSNFTDRKYDVKARKVGSTVEKIFHLEKKKLANGFCICDNPENKKRIEKLKVKFGMNEPEMNIVNNVNVSENDISELPF
ncbi:MAG: bifunctional DNA primase/polymerase [Candidatus Peregrinibacteria bacterium]|nr:bifunctional DNA primase/polymerase [Candidatus Peregrinibacteria bacterium]